MKIKANVKLLVARDKFRYTSDPVKRVYIIYHIDDDVTEFYYANIGTDTALNSLPTSNFNDLVRAGKIERAA